MTAEQQASFDEAARLNHCAGCLLKYGFRFEAYLRLEEAAYHAVSRDAKIVLLWRAALLRWELNLPITVH